MVDADRGLSATEVAEREARGQVNVVPRSNTRTVSQIVRSNVFTRFNALLGAMLAVILVVGPVQDALFGFVLIANAGIGIVQELRAKRTLDRLSVLTAPKAHVVRDGQVQEVPVDRVVLDDVLELAPGMQVVVDGDVLASDGLELDESLLTGESESVEKAPGDEAMSGSFVAAGAGRMVATAVGADAYAVKLALEAKRFALTRSELRDGVDQILRWVTIAIVPTAALLFVSQLRHHDSWHQAVRGAVAGTVAMVPEGLVLLMSLAFAVAVLRLAKRNVLVQELPAVEGLARVDVLCIDKTGTLTAGKLSVVAVETARRGAERGRCARGDRGRRRASERDDGRDRRPVPDGAERLVVHRVGAVLLRAEVERRVVRRARVVVRRRRRRPDRRGGRGERPRGRRRRRGLPGPGRWPAPTACRRTASSRRRSVPRRS